MNKALKEIKEVFDKYNVKVELTYIVKNGDKLWDMDLSFEGSDGFNYCIDGFWEGRIKAYNLDSDRCVKE